MKNKISKKIYFAVYLQIVLMISLTFSMSYLISQAHNFNTIQIIGKEKNSFFLEALKTFNKIFWSQDNIVSAASGAEILNDVLAAADNLVGYNGSMSVNTEITAIDLTSGIYTCPKDKYGRYCQEYPSSSCDTNCNVSCIPTPAAESAVCSPGTCYDSKEGSCAVGSTRQTCEELSGLWYNDPLGNINVCSAGCCVLGEKALFITETQCTKESAALGIQKIFRPELKTEISCLALSKIGQKEGACVVSDSIDKGCRFTTETNCKMNLKGSFYEGYLCSNPSFNTKCIKQKTTGCVEGKDELYWFDSCGNRENIYSINKEQSYNNGKVLSKENSCILDINNKYSQSTCGNCNKFSASVCGAKTATEKLSESNAQFVCKDLRCKDEQGNTRQHGESWCAYQSSIGLDTGVNGDRSTNSVGGRSFKKTCYEGEILTDPCADYNNEICTQSTIEREDKTKLSTAACRINRGYECYQYNEEGKKDECTKNPDCFIKEVAVSKNFKFGLCVPKYSPGFDLEERGEGASTICSFATQKCQAVKVKKLSGWKWVANKECANVQKFAEQMNDMCISLGDCGTKANYQGDISVNHKVFVSSKKDALGKEIGGTYGGLSNNYLNKLSSYANEKGIRDNYVEAPNLEEFYGELGIPGTLGMPTNMPVDKTAAVISQIQTISGVAGLLTMIAPFTVGFFSGAWVGLETGGIAATSEFGAMQLGPTFSAFAGALAGASIGFAAVSFLISWSGVGVGLPPAITYGLIAMGAAGGAILGIAAMQGGFSSIFSLSALPGLGWALLAAAVIIVAIFKALGIGKIKKYYYSFQCLPWEAPSGGAKCSECGKDGYPCSKYACESLGQNCQLVNENSQEPECVAIAKDDVSSPIIKLNESYLPIGFSAITSENGVKIKTIADSGCIPESYNIVFAALDIDESARCEVGESLSDIEEGGEFLSTGLYKKLHVLAISVPPLSTFGVESFNPNASAEKTYHIRCEDKNGNKNVKTYAINFCIMPGKDIIPPTINLRDPLEKVRHDATEINASVFTSEPAECKWSTTDKNYENMENDFVCLNDLSQRESLNGWRCMSTFNLDSNEKTYYVRCADQPALSNVTWSSEDYAQDPKLMKNTVDGTYGCFGCEETDGEVECLNPPSEMQEVEETSKLYCDEYFQVVSRGENSSTRNINNESYQLKFVRVEKALNIDYINVDNKTFEYNTTPASVEIIVRTSGGYDGSAKCSYLWGNQEIPFKNTFAKEHKQVSPAYFQGEYALTIKCEDIIGETAQRTAYFEINIDDSPPKITRTYSQGGNLYVITDEKASCYYHKDYEQNCYFDVRDKNASNEMIGKNSIIHSLNIDYNSVYNIKCVDEYGHYPGECSAVIKGVEI